MPIEIEFMVDSDYDCFITQTKYKDDLYLVYIHDNSQFYMHRKVSKTYTQEKKIKNYTNLSTEELFQMSCSDDYDVHLIKELQLPLLKFQKECNPVFAKHFGIPWDYTTFMYEG